MDPVLITAERGAITAMLGEVGSRNALGIVRVGVEGVLDQATQHALAPGRFSGRTTTEVS